MRTGVVAFFVSLLVATMLTPLVRRWAVSRNLLDRGGDGHRQHPQPVPRLGGLAIAAAVFTPIAGLALHQNLIGESIYRDRRALVTLFLGALGALGLGLVDDLLRTSARRRLLAMATLAAFTWAGGHRIDVIDVPHFGVVAFGIWSLPATMVWIVGVMVAFNFIDGLDGLAAGIALIGTLTMFVVAARGGDVTWLTWTGAMAGALIGFLIFNFNPATIFMGDCGSNFLGFMIAVVAMATGRKGKAATTLVVPFLAIGLPILDAALTMVRRAFLREGMFLSERGHLHHRLLDLGLSHKKVVLVLYGVTVVLSLGAVTLVLDVPLLQIAAAVSIAAVVFSLMFATGYVHPDDLRLLYRRGLANRARRTAVIEAAQEDGQHAEHAGPHPDRPSGVVG